MKKHLTKPLAIILALVMLFTALPMTAMAENETTVASGYWSYSNTWTLYDDGTLEFDSSATYDIAMSDYSSTYSPWFDYRELIKNIVFNCKVSKIGAYAFYECNNLETVTFAPGTSRVSIGDYAFYKCWSLTKMCFFSYYASNETIGEYAFAYCSSLKEVSIPTGFSLGEYAFKSCSELEKIYIYGPEIYDSSLTISSNCFFGVNAAVIYPYNAVIYDSFKNNYGGILTWEAAFSGPCGQNATWQYDADEKLLTICGSGAIASKSGGLKMPWGNFYTDITKIVIEDGIDYIPSYAFEYCENVEEFILPESVKYFCANAINDCKKLNNIILPSSIEEFGYSTFNRCSALTDLYYMGTAEEWAEIIESENISKSNGVALNIHFLVDCSTAPTCMNEGTETYYQFDKTDIYSDLYDANKNVISAPVVLPTTDHVFTNYVPNGDATHTSYGTKTAYCDYNCGNTDTLPGDSYDHQYTSEITTPATHLAEGIRTYTCECGDSYTEPVAKLEGHTYTSSITTPATHLAEGVRTYTCECGDSYTEHVAKLEGHTYTSSITTPSTHIKEGIETFTCECGDSYTESVAKIEGHTYTSSITTPATHIKEGVRTYTCECGDSYTENIVKLPGHNHYATETIYPTCSTEGYTVYTCECGDTYLDDYVDYDYDAHVNEDGDGLCDYCGELTTDCSCNCHSTNGFIAFFWKLLNFFQKLFGTNPVCKCGMAHY